MLRSDYEIITDGGRRRRRSSSEKLGIVEEALKGNGSEQALAATSDGRTTCTPGSLSNLDMIVVNFD